MTSWQTRPAAGVVVVGTDRHGSNFTHELKKIFDKYVYREKSQLISFSFYQKPMPLAFGKSFEGYVRCGPNIFANYCKKKEPSPFHAEHYVNVVAKFELLTVKYFAKDL